MDKDQLSRIENKLDKLLVQTTTNDVNMKNHMRWDKLSYTATFGIIIFMLVVHTAAAVTFISEKI